MKLEFDSNLQYQVDAIKSVTDLFEGQPMEDSIIEYEFETKKGQGSLILGESNNLVITEDQVLKNLQTIQKRNGIKPISKKLDGMNFSIEMETGTGKTYVYLRTIYELNKQYGFKKFVIVVPSVAIREGTIHSLKTTHEHLQNKYENAPIHFDVYNSSKVSNLRGFATSNSIEILVLNIDSFAKDENIINKPNDKLNGQKPIAFIQTTNPIVLIDEPQNMETDKRKEAINKLNSLCTLRYSATHRSMFNLVYSLSPVKAFDLGLVKQIEVESVLEENSGNEAFLSIDAIKAAKRSVSVKITLNVNTEKGVQKQQKTITFKEGESSESKRKKADLYLLSNQREVYRDGYMIDEIDASNNSVSFSNGTMLYVGSSQGVLTEEVMKFQIQKTVEEHLKKELKCTPQGIKVLSLFFIDKVANYRQYDPSGNPLQGKFALWFEEIYNELIALPKFKILDKHKINDTHNGYFASDKKGKWKDTKETAASTNSTDAADTFKLIMTDKEALLGLDNSLRFIFSHSALREGWDSPNVFQICTLNETKSEIKKRQEIGRGLRLAVKNENGKGVRIHDRQINRLTIIANESYEDFAKALQKEIEDECGVSFSGRIKNKRDRTLIKYRKGFEADPKFLELWEKLKLHTTYQVNYKTSELIEAATKVIKELPEITAPSVRWSKVAIELTDEGVETRYRDDKAKSFDSYSWKIPDVLGYIQSKTQLTRSTIFSILEESGRIPDILVNPQLFLDLATEGIKRTLYELMIDGIKYEKIAGSEYAMTQFSARELEVYLNDFTYSVKDTSKTIFQEYIPLDSKVETQFAKDCESSDKVKFYFKLPNWFRIPTPIGTYNPDWAVVLEDDKTIYYVAETKDTGAENVDLKRLKLDEQLKIKCGKAHFKQLDDVKYKVVKSVKQLVK